MHATVEPAHTPAPLTDRLTVLTPRGQAALAIVRLEDELQPLVLAD